MINISFPELLALTTQGERREHLGRKAFVTVKAGECVHGL